MTNEKAIKILKNHKEHWQRLLKEHICDKTECEEFTQALSIAINAIEAVDYDCANCLWYQLREQTRWIPVSERLPENAFGCLVTVEEDDIYGEPQRVIYPEFVGYDGETWNDASGEQIAFEVIAWIPLPEPYKAESEEEV